VYGWWGALIEPLAMHLPTQFDAIFMLFLPCLHEWRVVLLRDLQAAVPEQERNVVNRNP
jgi:hypothetical protein